MYKYAHGVFKELGIQRPASRERSFRCFSSEDQNLTNKDLFNTNDKKLKKYLISKISTFQADKQSLLAKKRKTLLWYKMILDKMLTPLVGLMPSIASSHHLSKLTDFRTNDSLSHRSEETTNKKIIMTYPKCVEEPLPILIKPEYKVIKSRKKNWKIFNKLTIAKDSKNDLLKKYKNWKTKYSKDHEDKKSQFSGKKQLILAYNIFLKNAIESKVEDLMPSIKAKDTYSNMYDLRVQTDPEFDQLKSTFMTNKKALVSKTRIQNTNKSLSQIKSGVPKTSQTKTSSGSVPIQVKTKPLNQFTLNKEDKVEILKTKVTVKKPIKKEIKGKPCPQRFLHKQNWVESDNIVKSIRTEAKDKPVMKKVEIMSKSKMQELVEVSGKALALENKVTNNYVYPRDKIEKGNSNYNQKNITKKETVEEFQRKCDMSMLLPEDEKFKLSHNILNEFKTSSENETETTGEKLEAVAEENQINNIEEICIDRKTEFSLATSTEKSDFKPNIIRNEKNSVIEPKKTASDDEDCHVIEKDIEINENQIKNNNRSLKHSTENVVNLVGKSESKTDSTTINSFTESIKTNDEDTKTIDSTLKNTCLVSLVMNDDDEGVLQTRSQVIDDVVKGDFVDLNIVIQEEKKAREERKVANLPQTEQSFSDLNTNKSELQSYKEVFSATNKDKILVNEESNTTFNLVENLSIKPPTNELFPNRNINTSTLNSTVYEEENSSVLKENSILDQKVDKQNFNIVKRNKASHKNVPPTKFIDNMISGHKNNRNRIRSLELIGQDTKGKRLKHKKNVNGKPILTNYLDKRSKVVDKMKEQDKSNNISKYQDIIDSVKKIIPSGNLNENTLEDHVKNNITDNKIKNSVITSKNYSKTINDLKDIISELPEAEGQLSISNSKKSQINVKKSESTLKSREERNVLSVASEAYDSNKQIKIKPHNKPKLLNLKNIKIVDKIPVVKEDLKPINLQKNSIGEFLAKNPEKDHLKIQLQSSKSHTLTNRNVIDNKTSNSQTEIKKHLAEGLSSLNFKIDMKNTPEYKKLAKYSNNIYKRTPLNENILQEKPKKSQSVGTIEINQRKQEESKKPIVSKNNKSIEIEKKFTVTKTPQKTRSKSFGENVSNMSSYQLQTVTKEKQNNNAKLNSHKTSNKERNENFLKSFEDSKNHGKIMKSNRDFYIHKTDASKTKESKISITISDNNKSRGIDRYLFGNGKTLQRNTAGSNVDITETKSNNQVHSKIEDDTQVSTEINSSKTRASENNKLKFAMEKFVKNAKNTIENPRNIIKFTRFNASVPTKSNKNDIDLSISEKEAKQSSAIKGKKNEEDCKNKQSETFQKSLLTSGNELQGKNKMIDLKTKKETQQTELLVNNMLKVKVISKQNIKRNIKASNDVSSKRDVEGNRLLQ